MYCRIQTWENLLSQDKGIFVEKIPPVLPPERPIEHAVEIDENTRPPMRPLYQLSPVRLVSMKDYIVKISSKGKKGRRKSL